MKVARFPEAALTSSGDIAPSGSTPSLRSGSLSGEKVRIRWKAWGKFCASNSSSNWRSSPPRSRNAMGEVRRWL